MSEQKKIQDLSEEAEELRRQLYEATETIEAIRTGQVDALIMQKPDGHQVYTLESADHAYRVFIEKMTEGAVTLNKDGVILYCNASFAEMIKQELSQVLGMKFRQLVNPAHTEYFDPLFKKCIKEDCKGETSLISGEHFISVQLSFAAMEQDGEKIYSIIITDLSEQKKSQKELESNNRRLEEINTALERSNRDLLQFASVASHDLQEPVRKIGIFSDLLKKSEWDHISEESKRQLGKIISSSQRMKSLITDMLEYSKLSYAENITEELPLNEVFEEVLEDLEFIIRDKNASVTKDDLPVIQANRGQMRQVFQNIISNALKFAGKDITPAVHVSAKQLLKNSFDSKPSESGKYYMLSIKDNGIGFEQKYAKGIFDLFERLNSKDAYEGTGIGLAITKKIVEKHHGMITAKSEENKGAEFLIILPA